MRAFRCWHVLLFVAALAGSQIEGQEPAVPTGSIRVATFNIQELNWTKLSRVDQTGRGTDPQLCAAAEILQRVRPAIVLINEIDYTGAVDEDRPARDGRDAAKAFADRYLAHSQHGAEPLQFPHRFYRASNTGVPTKLDLNNDGQVDGPNDAFGYGRYPGEYAMALFSSFPIDDSAARTFRRLRWKDMPGNLIPDGRDGRPKFYAAPQIDVFRLSSKSHWDVPVRIGERTLHLLCSHPTPPVFDGPEDAHGRRNHDELKFWADYLTNATTAEWIRDDQGRIGGLDHAATFAILGDLNSDPVRSESDYGRPPIDWVRLHPRVQDPQPTSAGAEQSSNPKNLASFAPFKTSEFGRLDYVLPSRNLKHGGGGVYWPAKDQPRADLATLASDHRLVWLDILWP